MNEPKDGLPTSESTHSVALAAAGVPTNLYDTSDQSTIVIGLYGIQGSGKSYLLKQLAQELDETQFAFFDGSQIIDEIVPGGLDGFKRLSASDKTDWRNKAIYEVQLRCQAEGRVGIVAGHLMFWSEVDQSGEVVWTKGDSETFTHILYLDTPPDIVYERRYNDKDRARPKASVLHLEKWQNEEKRHLRNICHDEGILFATLHRRDSLITDATKLLHDFRIHSERFNSARVQENLDLMFSSGRQSIETMLVLDADKTLAAEDAGILFWEVFAKANSDEKIENPLKTIFSSPLNQSYKAFRQAMLFYEENTSDDEFEAVCTEVASLITLYPEMRSLLKTVIREEHCGAMIVTCGLKRVWQKVLEHEGLSHAVKIMGGGRLADGFVVTKEVKAEIVTGLQNAHQMNVWAFGDSPLDLGMMIAAKKAIVVVGEGGGRSRTMEEKIRNAIQHEGLKVQQTLLPKTALPLLDESLLPVVDITNREFLEALVSRQRCVGRVQVIHATGKPSATLLQTNMRDANFSGPALRNVHHRVGEYLAVEHLTELIGLEEYAIPHVQGGEVVGHRLSDEGRTLIVALMRGGEPMAFGVNAIFPLAMFVHAKSTDDLTIKHLEDMRNVILVDSVVNKGSTVVEFENHIRKLSPAIKVVVVAGVVQEDSIQKSGLIYELPRVIPLNIVALRLSKRSYVGNGVTDTGNRLFNTTKLVKGASS